LKNFHADLQKNRIGEGSPNRSTTKINSGIIKKRDIMKIINYDIRKVVPSFREKDFETKLFVFVIEDHWDGTYVVYVYRKNDGNFNLCGLHIEGR